MKVSIIIPTYNRAHLIKAAILSVLEQTITNWELIIVDDGSSDNTAEVINCFKTDQRIKYIKKENSGAGHSRNVGVANAAHNIVTFLDSDDEAKPIWLENMIQPFISGNADIVCCGLSSYDRDGNLIDTKMPEKLSALFNGVTGKFTNGGSFILKKSIFENIGGYDNELKSGQHTELAMRLIPYVEKNKLKIINLHKALIKINIHDGARIRTDFKAKYYGSAHTYNKHLELLKKSKNAKSRYEGIIAFNAYKIGLYSEARSYALKSFLTKPTFKDFMRLVRYYIVLK